MVYDIIFNSALKEKSEKLGFKPIILDKSIIIKTDSRNELMSKLSKFSAKKMPIIVLGSTDEINRMALEDKRVDMLLCPEETRKKDFMKWRNSGLNHVLCKLCQKNNIKIGISFSRLNKMSSDEKSLKIGKIMQNIRLCRKYKAKIILASFAESESDLLSIYELKSIGLILGMTPQQVNESLENIGEI
jgi:RNase P/RNase MRP subunit p30